MAAMNYHHLFNFWNVVREGSEVAAARKLGVTQATVSQQVRALERSLREKLFERKRRTLVLTKMGQLVYQYANPIFLLGREMEESIERRPTGHPVKLTIGVSDALPKLIAYRVLEPLFSAPEKLYVVCYEANPPALVDQLVDHELDLVISDAVGDSAKAGQVRSYLLGTSGITLFARREIAARLRPAFPRSLHGVPMLFPTNNTPIRRLLEIWLHDSGVQPLIAGEFQDSALLARFGEHGVGVYPAPSIVEDDVRARFRLEVVGRVANVRQSFYALSTERMVAHPALAVVLDTARSVVFTDRGANAAAADRT